MAGEAPVVPAGGGAGAGGGGAPPPGAGGGGAPAGGGSSGASSGGGAAPVRTSSEGGAGGAGGAGQGGAPPPAGPKFLEREFTRDGKQQKLKASEDALWNAYNREQAINRRGEEIAKLERELKQQAEDAQKRSAEMSKRALREQLREQKIDPVAKLAEELEAAIIEQRREQDPATRQLMEKARENEGLRAELDGIKTREQSLAMQAAVEQELEKLSAEFMPALKASKLPKNDITMRLMAEARSTAKRDGLELTPEMLAREQHKAANEMIESMADGYEDVEDLIDAFPKFTRRLHEGLLKRHNKLKLAGQGAKVPTPRPEDRPPPKEEQGKGPRLVNSLEEHKAYHGDRKVLRGI